MNLLSRNSRILYTFKYIQIPKVWNGMICALCSVFTQKGWAQLEHLVLSVFLDFNSLLILTREDQVTQGHISSLWLSWDGEPGSCWLCWSMSWREKMLLQVTPWTPQHRRTPREGWWHGGICDLPTQERPCSNGEKKKWEPLRVLWSEFLCVCVFMDVVQGEGRFTGQVWSLDQLWRAAHVVVTKSRPRLLNLIWWLLLIPVLKGSPTCWDSLQCSKGSFPSGDCQCTDLSKFGLWACIFQPESCKVKSHHFPKRSHLASMPCLQTISPKWYLFEVQSF